MGSTNGSNGTRPEGRGLAAIYARISEDREGDALGVQRQEADCRVVCERRGFAGDRVLVYTDDDRSAFSGKVRPEYERLLRDIANGHVQLLVAWHPDRLHRSPIELERFITVVDAAGTHIETARAGTLDLTSPTGRMTARIIGAVARGESEHKSDRLKRKMRELAENGKVSGGGTRPFGFEKDRLALREDEAVIVREVAGRVLNGEALRSVCRDLIGRNVTTVTGTPWSPVVLRNMLLSARISGRREHHRVITADATWPAIITPVQSDGLRRLLRDASRRTAWTSRSYLLREVIVCGLCGKRLRARPTATGRRCYVCVSGPPNQGCGRIKIDAQYIEDDVVARIMHAVDSPEFARALAAGDDDGATHALAEVEDITSERDNRAAMLASGELSLEEWRIMSPILNDRLSAAQRHYDTLCGRDALHRIPRPLLSAWERFDDAQRRETVRDLVATVTVHAAKRGRNVYDPERVHVVWRV